MQNNVKSLFVIKKLEKNIKSLEQNTKINKAMKYTIKCINIRNKIEVLNLYRNIIFMLFKFI